MKWNVVSFVLKSKRRLVLLSSLEKPKTPTQLAKLMKSSLANISLKLADLSKKDLIECINPKDLKGRIYRITRKGKQVLKKFLKWKAEKKTTNIGGRRDKNFKDYPRLYSKSAEIFVE